MRVGVLVSLYPAPSHTFIRREVAELRRRGLVVETFSVRRAGAADLVSEDDRREAERTWSILPVSPWRLVGEHVAAVVAGPRDYFATLRTALGHRAAGIRAWTWSLFYFAEAILLARELRRRRVDHLHNHFANAGGIVGLLVGRYLGIGWSLTLHGISELDPPAGTLLGAKIEAASFVACASEFLRDEARRRTPESQWTKLFLSRCGLDLAHLPGSEDAARAGRSDRDGDTTASAPRDDRLLVVNVGRLSPEKGQTGLVEAFARARERGLDADLRIVGEGPERGVVEEAVARHDLAERVTLTGVASEEEALREIAGADVIVLSSSAEGLPVVIMEALAYSRAVVAPTVGGIPELVRDGDTGLLYPAGDWSALADGLLRLADDAALRERLGAAGRRRVEELHDVTRAVEPLLERLEAAG